MKTRSFLTAFGLVWFCALQTASAQVTEPDNTIGVPTSFVGCDAASPFPLKVMHQGNEQIHWYTDSLRRMLLTESIPAGSVNGYTVDQSGHLGIGAFNDINVNTPFTYLHIDNNGNQNAGFRNWMKAGMYITDESDQMYVGTYPRQPFLNDRRDAVINWSDNLEDQGLIGPDILRFIFTKSTSGSNTASTQRGLEMARMVPDTSGNEGFVGIGDWETWNLFSGQQPDERLHILDRTIRMNRLIPDYNNDTLTRVVMVDNTGRLHWRRINTWPSTGTGTADCKWTLLGVGNANIATAYAGNPGCPQETRNVGIGTASPQAKLHVERILTSSTGLQRTGYFNMDGGSATGSKVGVHAIATGTGTDNVGVKAEGNGGATTNYGVQAQANGTGTATSPDTGIRYGVFGTSVQGAKQSFGVRSQGGWATQMTCGVRANGDHGPSGIAKPDSIFGVWATSGNSIHRSYGVYSKTGVSSGADGADGQAYGVYCESGAAVGNNTPPLQVSYALYAKRTYPGASHPNNWAGWFDGNVMINGNGYLTGMVPITSDGNLKTNVEDLEDADSLLNLLAPKRYEFLTDQFPDLALAEGEQWGFIAQEVEEVIPDLVHKVTVPAFQDSLGNQTQAAMELRTLNYIGIIPLLVAGYQEQVATIEQQHAENAAQAAALDEMRNRLDQMEAALASCCANIGGGDQRATGASGAMDAVSGNERALTIQPNPFSEQTTLYYTLERSGRMQLMANSADGKQLRVLHEASLEAGQYQHEWHTSDLSPGVYYVTLLLDGEAVVKKAVKVQR